MISKVTGSTSATTAMARQPTASHAPEEPRAVAAAGPGDEFAEELDRHLDEGGIDLLALLRCRRGRVAAVGAVEAHIAEVLHPGGDHLREADRQALELRHRLAVDEVGVLSEHERRLVPARVALAEPELLRQPLRSVLPRQVEVAAPDSLLLQPVEAAVDGLHVLRLEVVVDDYDVREALPRERGADVDEHPFERLLLDVDGAGE